MTCFEKLRENHPGWTDRQIQNFRFNNCPDCDDIMDTPAWCEPFLSCDACWEREIPSADPTPAAAEEPHIRDSGSRTEFSTGAVRDIQKGKGRCDLMPLDVVARVLGNHDDPDHVLMGIATFMGTGQTGHLYYALEMFRNLWGIPAETLLLEVSKHFEEGAEKYGENNWQKGLPAKCYINSAVRHYLKWLRGDKDEFHDRAFCWNILCAIWTCEHKPELNDYGFIPCPVCGAIIPKGENECPHCRVHVRTPCVDPDSFMGEYEEEND